VVVRNGRAAERTLVTGAGALKVRASRVHDRREGFGFSSYILPCYVRRSPKVADVLPVLYLRRISTGDFAPAGSRSASCAGSCRSEIPVAVTPPNAVDAGAVNSNWTPTDPPNPSRGSDPPGSTP
jgi:hypothetical protein